MDYTVTKKSELLEKAKINAITNLNVLNNSKSMFNMRYIDEIHANSRKGYSVGINNDNFSSLRTSKSLSNLNQTLNTVEITETQKEYNTNLNTKKFLFLRIEEFNKTKKFCNRKIY